MGNAYPEIVRRQDFILKVIELEESRFNETLNAGLELMENLMAQPDIRKTGEIPGKEAFRLYDTYGFPVDITREIAATHGMTVDTIGFEREMEAQRERARAAARFAVNMTETVELANKLSIGTTPFMGYYELQQQTMVSALLKTKRRCNHWLPVKKAVSPLSQLPSMLRWVAKLVTPEK